MTTENGLSRPATIRHYINTLERRANYLEDEIEATTTDSFVPHFDVAELKALRFAISVCEAEWDAVARVKRTIKDEFDALHYVSPKAG